MRPGTFAATTFVLGAHVMLAVACETTGVECDCVDPALRVHVPAPRAAAVVDVVPSGPACAGARVDCADRDPATGVCTAYAFRATAAGNCHVDVDFSSGPPRFSADARLVPGAACCGGFYADPITAADIEVPNDGADAGGAG